MKLPRPLAAKGFTAIELILVIGILAVILALGLPVAWNFYLGYQIEVERDNLVALLREARTLSMVNWNESDHGLYFDNNNFIVFEGSSFASRNAAQDRNIPRSPTVQVAGPSELIFGELSGRAATSKYTLTSGARSRTVDVNAEGMVDW